MRNSGVSEATVVRGEPMMASTGISRCDLSMNDVTSTHAASIPSQAAHPAERGKTLFALRAINLLIELSIMAGLIAIWAGAIVPGIGTKISTFLDKIGSVVSSSSLQGR